MTTSAWSSSQRTCAASSRRSRSSIWSTAPSGTDRPPEGEGEARPARQRYHGREAEGPRRGPPRVVEEAGNRRPERRTRAPPEREHAHDGAERAHAEEIGHDLYHEGIGGGEARAEGRHRAEQGGVRRRPVERHQG